MQIITISRRWLRVAAMFSIAAVALNFLTLQYLAVGLIDEADLNLLATRKIIIDPGHGGIDDGASGNGIVEKEVNLAIALKIRDVLSSHGANVQLTREGDIDYYTKGKGGKRNDLLRRIEMINASGAEVFISVHVNSIRGTVRPGAQVFYSPKLPESKKIAEALQQALKEFPPGNKRLPQEDKDILVLNAPSVPGILLEAGFLSNSKEAINLRDASYQQKMAEMIAKGLAYHFSQNVGR